MSTRLLMNIALVSVTLLLVVSIGVVVTSLGDRETEKTQVDLTLRQQKLIQDLNQEVADLADADNLLAVNQARGKLGQTIVAIDQTLAALVKGGEVTDAEGRMLNLPRVASKDARLALEEGARIWVETGMPLADLAAGEYSIYSAAGQAATAALAQNSPTLANQMGIAATAMQVQSQSRGSQAGLARVAVVVFGILLGALGFARFAPWFMRSRNANVVAPDVAVRAGEPVLAPRSQGTSDTPETSHEPGQDWTRHSGQTFQSPVDFDSVSASVDQMSVDMNTIAGSTDKMRLAIDSVGHALHGMLYSLNEMAQDTAEGYKIVRGVNNAASFTATTAEELAASAREMSSLVSKVTQLALKTKQVSDQIDAEAVATGSTGEAFTSVVASEVQGLSRKTSAATREIEGTVASILETARQYDEAIGQIIKNISGINKVAENLGELMLNPPQSGQAGTPLPAPAPRALEPQPAAAPPAPVVPETPAVPEPAAIPSFEAEDDLIGQAPVEEVAAQTRAVIEEAAEETDFVLPAAEVEQDAQQAPQEEAPTEEPVSEDTPANEPVPVQEPEAEQDESSSAVFMLGGSPKKNEPEQEPVAEQEALAEDGPVTSQESPTETGSQPEEVSPAVEETQAESAPEEDDSQNIFILNKPSKKLEQDTPESPEAEVAAEEPAAETEATPETSAAEESEPAAEEDGGSNIFMLNKPKPAETKPAEPETSEDQDDHSEDMVIGGDDSEEPSAESEEPVLVPVGADDEPESDGGSNENIFMLNKTKK